VTSRDGGTRSGRWRKNESPCHPQSLTAEETYWHTCPETVETSIAIRKNLPEERGEALPEFIKGVLVNKLSNDAVSDRVNVFETSGGSPEPWIEDIDAVTAETAFLHFHEVGSVEHARTAVELGVDGITASGFEMGGHTHHPDEAVHSMVLVPSFMDAVDVPVLARGVPPRPRTARGALARRRGPLHWHSSRHDSGV